MGILDYIERIKRENEGPRITAQEPRNMADGGRIGFANGKDVKPGRIPGKDYGDKYRWKRKNWDTYQSILDDYSSSVDGVIKEGNITKIKSLREFFNEGKYKNEKGDLINRSTFESWVKNNNKRPVATKNIFKSIYNNAITKANASEKWISTGDFARSLGLKGEGRIASGQLQEWTKSHKTGLKELDSIETKVTRNANKLFSNLDQPVENFFSPMKKIGEMTGTSGQVAGKILKNYDFPADKEIIRSLGAPTVQGKISGMDWRLDDFIDYYNNKSFMDPSTLKQLANVDTTAGNIVQDAWRHTLDGGKDIEWIERPKLNKDGQVTSWLDAKFRYVGEGINTPLNQRKIWTVGNQNPDKNIFNIEFVGRDAPEFKRQFEITQEMFDFNNELVKHPVKGTMVKRGQLMKEMYHYGTGTSFNRSAYQRDHFDIKKDPFGLKKHKVNGNIVDGLRIIPSRINQAAGNIKHWKRYTEKGFGSPITKLKYAEKAGADKYTAIGYNFNKSPAELAASEYEFAKKFFNKFQAAGWNWDGKNWKIKPGMEDSANAVLTNEGRIIKSPIDIATDYQKIGQTILKEGDLSYFKRTKEKSEILQMAAGEGSKASKLFAQLYTSGSEGRKTLKAMTSLTGINDYLRSEGMPPICVTKSPKKCGMDLIKSEGGVDAYRSELEKRIANAKGDEKWFKAYNNPKLASVKNFFKNAGRKLGKFGKGLVWGEAVYIPFGMAYESGRGRNLLEAFDNSLGLGGHLGIEEKNLMKYADKAGYSEEDKKYFSQFAQLDKNDNWTMFWELAAAGDKWAVDKLGGYDKWWNVNTIKDFSAGKIKDLQTESENIIKGLQTGLGEGISGKYGEREYLKDVQAIDFINKAKEKEANTIINKALAEKQGKPSLAPHTPAPDRWLVMENLIDAFTQEDWLKKVKEEGLKKEKAGPLWSTLTSPIGAFYAASKDPRVDREKILEEEGREDLLYKEYMHPLYGPSFSRSQAMEHGRPYKELFPGAGWGTMKSRYLQADGGRAGYMGGGITGIRKPSALPPTGGPMSQGLRSLYIDDKDY